MGLCVQTLVERKHHGNLWQHQCHHKDAMPMVNMIMVVCSESYRQDNSGGGWLSFGWDDQHHNPPPLLNSIDIIDQKNPHSIIICWGLGREKRIRVTALSFGQKTNSRGHSVKPCWGRQLVHLPAAQNPKIITQKSVLIAIFFGQ